MASLAKCCPLCEQRHEANQPCPPPPMELLNDGLLMDVPDPEWDVEGRLVGGTLVELFGPSGRFKTTAAIDLGLCYTLGLRWLGAAVLRPGPVVYGAFEGGASLIKTKVEAWKRAHDVSLARMIGFHVAPVPVDLMSLPHVVSFLRAIDRIKPRAIFFDTLARSMSGDENSSRDMGLVVNRCDYIRRQTGALICLLHHSGKDERKGERGSSALRGAVDTVLHLNGSGERYVLKCQKQRHGAPFTPVGLQPIPTADGRSCLLTVGEVPPSATHDADLEGLILTFLKERPGVNGSFIASQIHKQKAAVLLALKGLQADGRVTSKSGGFGGKSQSWRLA
jgi:hypothetical protein